MIPNPPRLVQLLAMLLAVAPSSCGGSSTRHHYFSPAKGGAVRSMPVPKPSVTAPRKGPR